MRVKEIRESYKRLEREGKLDEFKDNNGSKLHYLKKDRYPDMYKKAMDVLHEHRRLSNKINNGYNNNNNNGDNNDIDYEFHNTTDGVSSIIIPSLKLSMITIPTWMLSDLIGFYNLIVDHLFTAKGNGFDRIIINQIGNTGGFIIASRFLFSTLFPRQYKPDFIASFPETEANLLNSLVGDAENLYASASNDERIKTEDDYKKSRNVKVKGTINDKVIERSRKWSKKYYSTLGPKMDNSLSYLLPSLKKSFTKKIFTPENTILLSDGVCGSACAMFTKYASQKKLATTMNIGNVLYNPDNKKSDIADSCSENVIQLDQLYKFQEELGTHYSLPPELKRLGGLIRYPTGAKYSFNKGEEDTMMEFKLIEPDYIHNDYIDYYNHRDPKYLVDLAIIVSQYFDKCVSWHVKANTTCEGPSEGKKIDHAIYGNPCNAETSSYDTSKCVFARCEDGYYYKDNKCKIIPELDYNDFSEDGVEDIFNKQWKRITCLLISLFIAVAELL